MGSSKKNPKLAIDEEQLTTIIRLEKHRVNQVECGRETKFQIFKRITVDEKETDYVICLSCNDWKLIKYDTKKGTSNVNYHLLKSTHLNKSNNNDQPTINKFMIKSIPMSDRQRVYDKIALWCAQDNRPFNIVESEAFKAVIESIIQVTAKIGMVDVNELLPCKETVRNHSKKLYEDLRLKLINYLKSVDYINFTTDHWKDKMSGASYMTICIHYFNQKIMTLENRTIATIEVGNKCADTTAASFQNELIKLEVESKLRMVVTDNASSMVKAFNGIKWISCAGHNICLLQKYSFNDQENKDIPDPFQQLSKLIISAKALVKRVKKGNYNFDLLCRLKQECETRWDSMFDMLESISKNYSILVSEPSLRSFMDDIGAGLLQEVLEIIKPVKELRTALSSDKNITLNLVSLTYLEIRKIMVPCAKDSPSIQILKKRFLKFLNGKFPISEHHIIATFLSPAYRSVPKEHCESKLVKDAMKLLHSYVDEIPESETEQEISIPSNESVAPFSGGLFSGYREKPVSNIQVSNEISEYKRMELSDLEINTDALKFWMSKRKMYPKLSRVAFWILACPATSTSSERVFSKLGTMITPIRNQLDPETVNRLSFISSNEDLIKV